VALPDPTASSDASNDPARARAAAEQATLMVADTIAELMEFWNFKPSMGRVWAVLYLSRAPLDAVEIGRRSGLSSGSVSMTLADLQHWGVVRRAWPAGERRKVYEAETDVVAMVTRVFRERELRMVSDAVQRLEAARRLLDEQGRSSSAEQMLEGRFLATRIDAVLGLARVGRRVVEQLALAGAVDLGPIREALRRR
jgi:DNA-binding transcriptional regulator GbsR (MarR family)